MKSRNQKIKSLKDYIIKEQLGIGSFGKVYKVIKKESEPNGTKQVLVLKQISLFNLRKEEVEEVNKEAKILSSLNSKYIVKYFDSWIENSTLNIIMEYCEKGDLGKYIKSVKDNKTDEACLPEEEIWRIFIQICIGLSYLHNKKILHRDLKTQNILMNKYNLIKIADLGVAKVLDFNSFAKTFVGTPYYLSPEICEEKPYNEKSDVWALGCCIYQMATGKHPFNANSQPALIMKILKEKYSQISNVYSKELGILISLMLEKNHFRRPKVNELMRNEHITKKIYEYKLNEMISIEMGIFPNLNIGKYMKMNVNIGKGISTDMKIKNKKSDVINKHVKDKAPIYINSNIDLNKNQSKYKKQDSGIDIGIGKLKNNNLYKKLSISNSLAGGLVMRKVEIKEKQIKSQLKKEISSEALIKKKEISNKKSFEDRTKSEMSKNEGKVKQEERKEDEKKEWNCVSSSFENEIFESMYESIKEHNSKMNQMKQKSIFKSETNSRVENNNSHKNGIIHINDEFIFKKTNTNPDINTNTNDFSIHTYKNEFKNENYNDNPLLQLTEIEKGEKEEVKIVKIKNEIKKNQNIGNDQCQMNEIIILKDKFQQKIQSYKQSLVDILGRKVTQNLMDDYIKVINNDSREISYEDYLKIINEYAIQHCPEMQEKVTEIILFIFYYDNQLGYIEKEIKSRNLSSIS